MLALDLILLMVVIGLVLYAREDDRRLKALERRVRELEELMVSVEAIVNAGKRESLRLPDLSDYLR